MKTKNQSQVKTTKQSKTMRRKVRAAADGPTPGALTPEQYVEQLRALRQQLDESTKLTPAQRKAFRALVRNTAFSVQSSINIIGVSDNVSQAVGVPADEARQMVDMSNRWSAVEDELRAMLKSVSDANLSRKHQIALLAAQAYGVGSQLARDPENADLESHLQEVRRQKGTGRRKKASPATEPAPAPNTPNAATSEAATESKM
jgi:hypothetical protein